MKILVLAALIAAASSGRLSEPGQEVQQPQWPWQTGKVYRYDVESQTLAQYQEGASTGNAFRARFIIRVKAPGQLQVRLENPQHAQVHQQLAGDKALLPELKYQPVQGLDKPFEVSLEGGRVLSLNLPSTVSLPHENLLKGLIGALQVDLSTHRNVRSSQDNYDKESFQGLFSKMEPDVTGDCETLYSVSPAASEWRRELPNFTLEEEPIEITKSKNYGHCHLRVAYHFGVPDGAEWTGTAHKNHEEQFIERATTSRILVGKQGPIFKAETTSTVYVHPLLYGKQKAEVSSSVKFQLVSSEQDNEAESPIPEGGRKIWSLLYVVSPNQMPIHDQDTSSESSEHDHIQYLPKNRAPRSTQSEWSLRKDADDRSHSSSSSSDSSSAYINDNIPSNNEPAYAALYMIPQPRVDLKQNKVNAQKLLKDMAQQLQNPNNMPKADILSKFNILVRLIASMSKDQLVQVSSTIEVTKSSNNPVETDMWMIYRDAVVQAGTFPAFQQIKIWIHSKKLQGEEAAQVVATLVSTLRYPTKDLMMQFLELATSADVTEQRYLNTTALLAATKLINMAQVNNETAHSFYPTHMYGRLAHKHDRFVPETVIPLLAKQLKEAIERDDSSKAQVYIKAIGNIGHRDILDVFAPYLQGKIPVSTYLRMRIVSNLQVLANQGDRYVRAVLYSILKNTAEPYEVRVAAVHNIFMTDPTAAMMQSMAQMTQDDPSVQVRAALKSGIESAAELKNPHFSNLKRTAQSVKEMLTKKKFGYQYSTKSLSDDHENDFDLGIFSAMSHIGSEDSLFPKQFKYSQRSKSGGWNKENTISTSFSSIQQIVDFFRQQMSQQYPRSDSNHKYSADKIPEMINFKRDPQNPLEASIYIDLINQQRFFTFSEDDLRQLPIDINQYMSEVKNGVEKHYTKVLNQAQVSIMFPVAMGMPFIYKYKEPTLIHIKSKLKGQINFPSQEKREYTGNMDKDVELTFARNIDGSAGFIDTLSNQYASAGVVSKFQVQIPVKLNVQIKSGEVKVRVEPMRPDQDSTVLHYSVWPYTANQKKDTLVTISQDPTTKVIERSRKVISTDTKFGQGTGIQFQLQGYSYSSDYNSVANMFQSRGFLANIAALLYQRDVAMTHFNLRHLGKQSQNKAATFSVVYDTYYNQKQGGEMGPAANKKNVTPNSGERRREMINQVAAGINTARVQIVDLSATFDGAHKQEYVMTAALGDSPVDSEIQYSIFAAKNSAQQGNSQLNSVGKVQKPQTWSLNLLQALNNDLKLSFVSDIKYQGNGNIHIEGQAQRSKKYTEELQKLPQMKRCAEDIASGNLYQHVCHEMIVMAHSPDYLKASVTYKDVSPTYRNIVYQAYKIAEHYGFWYTEVNPLKATPDGRLDIEVQASFIDSTLNLAMNSRYGDVRMKNVPIPKVTSRALAIYSPETTYELVQNYYTGHQFQPYCSVDGSKIKTFSNRSYEYTLSRSWHVVMFDDNKQSRSNEQLAILARRPKDNEQEVYISYKSQTGKDLEIEIRPTPEGSNKPNVNVKTNAKRVSEGDLTIYWDDAKDQPLLEYYAQPDGVVVLNIQPENLRAIYDGQRLVVISDAHRNRTRGICGLMSGERRDDYLTPNGLVDKPEYYAASFTLNDDNSDPKTQQQKEEAKNQAYQPQNKFTNILQSDKEWQKAKDALDADYGSESIYRSRSYKKQKGACQLEQQVQYYENHVEMCITTTPLPACQSHCSGDGYRVQAAQVICHPKLDQQFWTYRDQIRQGQNPKVSSGVPKLRQYRVPSSCKV